MPRDAQQEVEHLRVKDGWDFEMLASGGGPGQNKDARADNGTDAEGGEAPWAERLLEPVVRLFRFGDQLVDGFSGEVLVCQSGGLLSASRA
jgi:hypothetical protein